MVPRIVAVALAALSVLVASNARPSATDPTLVVSAASAMRADGRYAVTIDGEFDFPNAVQVGYPLHLVVFQGSRFVRFPIAAAPVTGESSVLDDGQLAMGDISTLLAAGAPAPADVRVVALSPTRAVVSLPAGFAPGAATAQVFATLSDGRVLSNPLALVLP
jgi:hypothetical protein